MKTLPNKRNLILNIVLWAVGTTEGVVVAIVGLTVVSITGVGITEGVVIVIVGLTVVPIAGVGITEGVVVGLTVVPIITEVGITEGAIIVGLTVAVRITEGGGIVLKVVIVLIFAIVEEGKIESTNEVVTGMFVTAGELDGKSVVGVGSNNDVEMKGSVVAKGVSVGTTVILV